MGKHFIGNEIKWYKPFKLVKRVKELEKLTQEQFIIINDYKDELAEKKALLESLQRNLASLQEDFKILKGNTIVSPDEAIEKPKRTRKTTTKKDEKEPVKRGRKKKEEK